MGREHDFSVALQIVNGLGRCSHKLNPISNQACSTKRIVMMNLPSQQKLNLALTGIVVALNVAVCPSAHAFPQEGSYDFTACLSGTTAVVSFSKSHFGYSYEAMGSTRSTPPGGMMDNSTVRCVGMNASLGGKVTQNTLCETVDGDGDKQLAYLTIASDGRITRDVVSGTGKFEGLQMSGISVPLGPFPTLKPGTFQNCSRQTGTYKMK
jgi:hypothetical protein